MPSAVFSFHVASPAYSVLPLTPPGFLTGSRCRELKIHFLVFSVQIRIVCFPPCIPPVLTKQMTGNGNYNLYYSIQETFLSFLFLLIDPFKQRPKWSIFFSFSWLTTQIISRIFSFHLYVTGFDVWKESLVQRSTELFVISSLFLARWLSSRLMFLSNLRGRYFTVSFC